MLHTVRCIWTEEETGCRSPQVINEKNVTTETKQKQTKNKNLFSSHFMKTPFNRNNCKSQFYNKIWKTRQKKRHWNAASDISAQKNCISVCLAVRKAARVNIHIAIPSTPGQFTVMRPTLAAQAHQLNIYWEREAACKAAFGAKHSAKPHWQSQLRSSEALQEESDTAPVQREATVKRLYLPSPLLSFKNQLTGSLSRSFSPPPLRSSLSTSHYLCVCLSALTHPRSRALPPNPTRFSLLYSRQPSSTTASSKINNTQKKGAPPLGEFIFRPMKATELDTN